MNLVDVLLAVFLLYYCIAGFRRGTAREALSLVGLVAGVWLGSRFAGDLASGLAVFDAGPGRTAVLAYGLLVLGCLVAARIVARLIMGPRRGESSMAGKAMGGGMGFAKGVFVSALALLMAWTFFPDSSMLSRSTLAGQVAKVGGLIMCTMPEDARKAVHIHCLNWSAADAVDKDGGLMVARNRARGE